jgi:UDP-N-acetylglucosamine acyltransferase
MNSIHPTAIIGRGVQLGTDNVIGPYAVIGAGARIGDRNWIGPHVVIGAPPEVRTVEHRDDWIDSDDALVLIGNGNVMREAVQIHSGWKGVTTLGDEVFVMNRSYVAHDAHLADRVTLASGVTLAGTVTIGHAANLGISSSVHQGRSIGAFAMVGMGSVVARDLPAFALSFGSPAKPRRANAVGMERAGFDPALIAWVEDWVAGGAAAESASSAPAALLPYFSVTP